MHRGYLPLWRKSQDHPFFKERRIYSKWEAWLDMLLETRHNKDTKEVVIGMQVVTCKYGESIYSLQTWGMRWGWSPTKVKRFFDLLTKMNQIRYESVIVTTRVSILNYEKYDPKCNGFVTEKICYRKANDFESLTNNNVNNVNNEKKPPISPKEKSKQFVPPSIDDVKKYFVENGYSEKAATTAFNFYSVADWFDSKGNKVKNWKQKMISVWFKKENKDKTYQKPTLTPEEQIADFLS